MTSASGEAFIARRAATGKDICQRERPEAFREELINLNRGFIECLEDHLEYDPAYDLPSILDDYEDNLRELLRTYPASNTESSEKTE
ncbi:unnamed protein product [Larinioides sclopetarius]|uniref:Uncharacterized protein n=1 Tax=Larinioides sclopetarius TaxID=280406 RepID=A0AAV2ACR1_9ARAC